MRVRQALCMLQFFTLKYENIYLKNKVICKLQKKKCELGSQWGPRHLVSEVPAAGLGQASGFLNPGNWTWSGGL